MAIDTTGKIYEAHFVKNDHAVLWEFPAEVDERGEQWGTPLIVSHEYRLRDQRDEIKAYCDAVGLDTKLIRCHVDRTSVPVPPPPDNWSSAE